MTRGTIIKAKRIDIWFCLLCIVLLQALTTRAQLPTITNQPNSQALWAGGNVTFAVGVSGTGPFTYQWQLNNTNLPNGIITTVAGNGANNGRAGYSGDGGAATNTGLYWPSGCVVDTSGNLFIADTGNNRIRKVGTNGIITTVAGNTNTGFSGDLGAATNASLNQPSGVAVDGNGNVFIVDSNNARVRKVGTNGIITTVVGNGSYTDSGDGGQAYFAAAYPLNVTTDAHGNLFIADALNCLREVTNGIINTIVGNHTGMYSGDGGAATNAGVGPQGVAVDTSGNIFIADVGNNRIREVTNGIITTVAGSGPGGGPGGFSGDGGVATNASLNRPCEVSVDTSGNIFIADNDNNRIRKVSTNGIITTVAGGGTNGLGDGGAATNASLNVVYDVAVDAFGNLFISDTYNGRIRKVTNTQGPILELNDISAANAGNYRMIVTGPGGCVTSSVAYLNVTTTPLIYKTVKNSDGSIAFNFVSQPGSTNVVLCATNLSPPVLWQPLSTNLAGAEGDWQFTDTNAFSYQSRFYRSLTH